MSSTIATRSRWVMLDSMRRARSYTWPQCSYCGRAQNHDCPVVECMLCGSPQCHGNGSGNGLCAICHHGYLPGWSRGYSKANARTCAYAGCDQEAVATARKRAVCAEHAKRVKVTGFGASMPLTDYVQHAIAARDAGKGWQRWTLVD